MSSQKVPRKIDLSMLQTQVVNPATYNSDNLIFDTIQVLPVPGMKNVNYRRINIYTLNEDKSIGELVLATPRLFSYGVKSFTDEKTGEVNGHTLALCCWSRDGPTDEEKAFTDCIMAIVEKVKSYLLENKNEIERYNLVDVHLSNLDPLYWKEEKGQRVEGVGPVLNAKLIATKKNNDIKTEFYDLNGDKVTIDKITEKYCHATAAVKFESIYIASGKDGKIKLQVKLWEACIEVMQNNMKRLLPQRPRAQTELKATSATNMDDLVGSSDESKEDDPIVDDNDTAPVARAAPAPATSSATAPATVSKPATAKRTPVKAKPVAAKPKTN